MIHLDFGNIGVLEKRYVMDVLDSGYVSTASPWVDRFEEAVARYVGGAYVLATNSGTAALHLALLACGVGPGDEVIVPVTTFVATANVVRYVGATPVFVDVDPQTWCMDTVAAREVITERTKVLILVHLYGNPCDLLATRELATFIIEDAAEALGTTYNQEKIGDANWSDYICLSFNGNKIMTTGGGGAVITAFREDKDRLFYLATQAKNEDGTHGEIGYNARMTGLSAGLGLAQLERIDEFVAKKRRFNQIYREQLPMLTFQEATPHSEPNWWHTAATFPEHINIESLQEKLKINGIPTRRIFRPLVDSPPYRDGKEYPNARYIYDHGLCLPSSTCNAEEDIYHVCEIIRRYTWQT